MGQHRGIIVLRTATFVTGFLLAGLLVGGCADGQVYWDTDPDSDTDSDSDSDSDTEVEDDLYRPDDGPTADEGLRVVDVCSEAEILAAIGAAEPGDVITVCPGTFAFNQRISVSRDGRRDARIFLRAAEPGTVTFELSHLENFNIRAKAWIFENITFRGACTQASSCEHAFHIVGDADDLIFRNNEVVDFASHVKLNAEVTGEGPAKSFPDRAWFIGNFWHNTRYVHNNAPHNILNLDGGQDHVVRGNLFADYNTPASLPKSASAVYPKASARGILIEQNLIVCEKARTDGETARGIQLGDGAPASICDGDDDGDGFGDCVENGQSQEALVRNNIVLNCNNGGSAAGIMVGSDRDSRILHNTVLGTGPRAAGFYIGHPDHDTFWRRNVLEDGINTAYAERAVDERENLVPSGADVAERFGDPGRGDLTLVDTTGMLDRHATDPDATHDFCGYPRGDQSDLGAIEVSTAYEGVACVDVVQEMFDRIP